MNFCVFGCSIDGGGDVKTEFVSPFIGLAYLVHTDHPAVERVGTESHALGVANRVVLNVVQLIIAARLVEVGRLAYHHLTHLVKEEALFAGEQPQNGPSLHSLPLNELAQVHLFVKARLRLV